MNFENYHCSSVARKVGSWRPDTLNGAWDLKDDVYQMCTRKMAANLSGFRQHQVKTTILKKIERTEDFEQTCYVRPDAIEI